MKDILNQLIEYKSLDKGTAKEILTNLAQGKYNQSQVAAFLTVYLMRSITVEELEGFRDAMLDLCVPVEIPEYDAIDLCGTGGDGKNTFNISTLSSFIVAAAGQNVAKHGNNGVSSVSGSSNLMAHFGYEFTNDIDQIKKSLDACGLCFLHAPLFHPAMKNVAPIRRELGVKTFFNMLGPLVNPSFPKNQITGVFNLELARLYNYLLQKTDINFTILYDLNGYDEISLTGNTKTFSKKSERLIKSEDFGLNRVNETDISGGKSIESSAKIFMDIIQNKGTKAQHDVVCANAGTAISTTLNLSIREGFEKAMESLKSGDAFKAFKKLKKISQK